MEQNKRINGIEPYLDFLKLIILNPDIKQTQLMSHNNTTHEHVVNLTKIALYNNHIKGINQFRILKQGLEFFIITSRVTLDFKETYYIDLPKERTILSNDENCDYNVYSRNKRKSV